MRVHPHRIRKRNSIEIKSGPIVYWMSRDQRAHDNWALLYAQELAHELKSPLIVFFGLTPSFLGATIRQYDFMLRGLEELEAELRAHEIPLIIRSGAPHEVLLEFCAQVKPGAVVCDFSPLRVPRMWKDQVSKEVQAAFYEVDAHNIIPCWHASAKQEFAAYTFRPKVHKLLDTFLTPFPKLGPQPVKLDFEANDFKSLRASLEVDMTVTPVDWIAPGEKAALKTLQTFIKTGIDDYTEKRNDVRIDAQSQLSPYLHFGQISAQRVAWDVSQKSDPEISASFLEELIVRRELADNFCFYNPDYDSVKGFPAWAKQSLDEHRLDPREYIYSDAHFEEARTHDDIWNDAQDQMRRRGKMHGYLRMYWAKKILEWTKTPEEAMRIAIWLNDKYELDGRDPNGYCGIAWSLGGVHDRPWFNRPIFGKVRFMSYNGIKKKYMLK